MSNPSQLGAIRLADESSFGEVSTTFDERLSIVGAVDPSGLTQEKVDIERTVQYQNDGHHDIRGVQGGSVSIDLMLSGHGGATTGSISATAEETFLGRVIGNLDVTQIGTTAGSTWEDADSGLGDLAVGGTFLAGGLCRIGVLNDGEGEGQFHAISTFTDNGASPDDIVLLTAAGGTPQSGVQIYAPALIFPNEGPTATTVTSMRLEIMTANQQYQCHGCYPTAITFSGFNAAELPRASVTMAVSRWTTSSGTFPTATSQTTNSPAPVAAGSFYQQNNGTTTRQTRDIRDFNLSIDLGMVPLVGPGAVNAFQNIIGVRRTKCQATFDFVLDSEAAGTDTFGDIWNTAEATIAYHHILYSLSIEDGRAIGFYFPRCLITGQRPTQLDLDGINRKRVFYRAISSATTTTELTNANFVLGIG